MNWLADFHWIRPAWLLAVVPLLWLCWQLGRGRGQGPWRLVCDPALLDALQSRAAGRPQRWPQALAAVAGLIAIVALAGPSWQRLHLPVFQSATAKVLVLDLSKSMDAADLAPSRLARARFAALDILEALPEGRVGVVVFAGSAFPLVPLTDDRNTARHLIQSLDTRMMPIQGGRIGAGLEQAMALLDGGQATAADIILITDSPPLRGTDRMAEGVRASGHRLWIVGVGTADGAPIPADDGGWVKDAQGAIVLARLDEPALRALAASGGGAYQRLPPAGLTQDSFAFADARAQTRQSQDTLRSEVPVDAGQWLVWLLLPLAALGFRRGWLGQAMVLLCLAPMGSLWAAPSPWWANADQRGQALLEAGQAEQAAETFADPQWQAVAKHQAGAHDAAAEQWATLDTADAHYNRGNALARAGQLQDALAAYDAALARQPDMDDARHNRALVEQLMQQQEQQPQNAEGESGDQNQQSGDQGETSQGQSGEPPAGEPEDNADQNTGDSSSQDPSAGEPGAQREQDSTSPTDQADNATDDPAQREQADPSDAQAGDGRDPAQATAASEAEQAEQQAEQALEQWLRRVPDDPGGLLRRKFQRQQQRRDPVQEADQPW